MLQALPFVALLECKRWVIKDFALKAYAQTLCEFGEATLNALLRSLELSGNVFHMRIDARLDVCDVECLAFLTELERMIILSRCHRAL